MPQVSFVLLYLVTVVSLVLSMTLKPRLVKDSDLSSTSSEENVEMFHSYSTVSERDVQNSPYAQYLSSESLEEIDSFSTYSDNYERRLVRRLHSDGSDSSQSTESYEYDLDSSEPPEQIDERELNDNSDVIRSDTTPPDITKEVLDLHGAARKSVTSDSLSRSIGKNSTNSQEALSDDEKLPLTEANDETTSKSSDSRAAPNGNQSVIPVTSSSLETTVVSPLLVLRGNEQGFGSADDWWNSDPTFKFMNWTVDDIHRIPREILIDNLWTAEKIDLTAEAKTKIWKQIKQDIEIKSISVNMLKSLRSLIYFIPEKDLFQFDMTNWKLVHYVGSIPGFTRRQLGVLSYAMIKVWGDEVMFKTKAINTFGNLICGFPPKQLANLPPETLFKLKASIFTHTYGCTPRQLRNLLDVALMTAAHGPVDMWDERNVKHLGLLITQMTDEELLHIRPKAMKGIKASVVQQLTNHQLKVFLQQQVLRMTPASIGIYRWRIGLKSSVVLTTGDRWMVMIFLSFLLSLR